MMFVFSQRSSLGKLKFTLSFIEPSRGSIYNFSSLPTFKLTSFNSTGGRVSSPWAVSASTKAK